MIYLLDPEDEFSRWHRFPLPRCSYR